MENTHPFLVETDIIIEFLTTEHSTLRAALRRSVCYTTFHNALELFTAAHNKKQEEAIQQALMSLRLLGLNWRNARPFAETARKIEERTGEKLSAREAITAGMAEMSKLTILTKEHYDRYRLLGLDVRNHVE